MAEDYHSLLVNSYGNDQRAALLPIHLLPPFRGTDSRPKSSVKLMIQGFPSNVTESGLKSWMQRIGCQISGFKIIQSKSHLGRGLAFADFNSTRSAQKAIELLSAQEVYKLSVSFTSDVTQNQLKEELIAKEITDYNEKVSQEMEDQIQK